MPIPNWEHPDSEWDDLTLAGIPLPGVWTLDLAPECKIDVKKSSGSDGGRIVDKGYAPAEIDCLGTLVAENLEAWEAAVRKLHPKRTGGKRSNVSVRHPNASLLGVKFMKIRSISGVEISTNGMGTVKIRGVQWVAKPKEVKKSPPTSETSSADLAYPSRPWLGPHELFGKEYRDVDKEVQALVDASEKNDPQDLLYKSTQEEYATMISVGPPKGGQ